MHRDLPATPTIFLLPARSLTAILPQHRPEFGAYFSSALYCPLSSALCPYAFTEPSSHRRHRCSRDVGCRSSQDQSSRIPPRGEYISAPRSHRHTHRRWPALLRVWQSQHRQYVTPGRQNTLVMLVPRNICDFYVVDRQLDRQIISEVGGPLHNQPRAAAMSDCLNFRSCAENSASDY